VFKEKPMAVSLAQAKELDALAKENNIQVMVALQRRFNPIYSTFFQLIDKIGKVFYIEAKYTFLLIILEKDGVEKRIWLGEDV